MSDTDSPTRLYERPRRNEDYSVRARRWVEKTLQPMKESPWFWVGAIIMWIGLFFFFAWLGKVLWNSALRKFFTTSAHIDSIWPVTAVFLLLVLLRRFVLA